MAQAGVQNVQMPYGNGIRLFLLIVPENYDHATALPLLLFFHGGGGNAQGSFVSQADLRLLCQQNGVILAFMQGATAGTTYDPSYWNATFCCAAPYDLGVDDVGYVLASVAAIRADLNVDAKRIYATGFSNGGMMTHRLGAEYPDVFAAIAPVSAAAGGRPHENDPEIRLQPMAPIPIILIHGKDDTKSPFNGGLTATAGSDHVPIAFSDTLALWATANGCPTPPMPQTVTGTLGNDIDFHAYAGCPDSADVLGIAVGGMAHTWPDSDAAGFDGTNAIFTFLLNHSK